MDFVFDASALIVLFEKCDLREQLREFSMSNKLFVPSRVYEEFKAGEDIGPSDAALLTEIFEVVSPNPKETLLPYFNFKDSSGEFWVLSYALDNPQCCCVVDEEFGRRIAELFNLKLTGTIGIIEAMKKSGILLISDLLQIMDSIRKSKFYLSKKMLSELEKICSR